MQRTEHYNLSKPERMDPFRAQDVADNLDAIDEAIHNAAESGTASVDGMDIRPASVNATGAVSGSSVSDSVGSLADLRDSVSLRFGMRSASSLGLSASTDNLDWYWNKFGKGVCFFWVDGWGKLTNQPHGWGNAFMFIFNKNDMCQVFIDTRNKVNLRTSNSATRTWNAWTALN